MRTFRALLLFALALLAAPPAARAAPLRVVTTLFPLYDWARTVGGEAADVSLLLPPGVEAHSFSPTPRDVLTIAGADIFIFTSHAMEPWVDGILKGAGGRNLLVVDAGSGILPGEGEQRAHHEDAQHAEAHQGHDHHGVDPHIWLDFANAAAMVDTIAHAFMERNPAHRARYAARAEEYKARLADMDARFATGLADCAHRTLVYGGHFAFGRFARRYHLTHVSPYKGFAPDAEPTPRDMADLIHTMRAGGHEYIFYEEGIEPKVARLIGQETGAGLLLLHGAHNLGRDELAAGATYLSIMQGNLKRLRQGLVCR